MNKRSLRTGVVIIVVALGGCGGNDSDGPGSVAGGGASGAAGSTAGTGGAAGTSGTGGSSGAGGSGMTAQPVPCGTMMCQPPASQPLPIFLPVPLPMPVACCLDAAAGRCGTAAMAGAACEAPAQPDTRCPSIALGATLGGGGFGCCTQSGQCGVDGSLFGRGCVENAQAMMNLADLPVIGPLIMIPPPMACDAAGGDGGVDEDGGI